jgi:hypothetical protein
LTRRLAAILFAVAVIVACVDQGEKPPPPVCEGCVINVPPVIHEPPPDGGSAGAGGEPGTDEPVRVQGDVVLLNDIAAKAAVAFVESAELRAQAPNGDVRGTWNGSDPFSLEGVPRSAGVWTEVTPFAGDALVTLQPMNTLSPGSPEVIETRLAVVSALEIELALGAISTPLTPDPRRAQAVLLASKNDVATAGVSVSATGVEAVIYVDGGVYTDAATETDASGVVVLANVPVPSTGSIIVRYEGEVSGSSELRLVAGGVTYGGIGN